MLLEDVERQDKGRRKTKWRVDSRYYLLEEEDIRYSEIVVQEYLYIHKITILE